MNLQAPIFDKAGKLRSGWRFALFIGLFVVFYGAGAVMLVSAFGGAEAVRAGTVPLSFIAADKAMALAVALGVGWFCGKYLEGVGFRVLGAWATNGWARHLLIGSLLGFVTFALAAALSVAAGGIAFDFGDAAGGEIARSMAIALGLLFLAGAFEEALFRGYILQTFARAGLAWFAILLTAVFFALIHLGNPSANWISSLNTGLAGIWFGIAYLKTRDLWFVTGLHVFWNWTQGAVFGIEVSGLTQIAPAPLLREVDLGPAWLSGGAYGIEGGVVTTAALLASMAAVWFLPGLRPDPELLAATSPQAGGDTVSRAGQ